MAKISIPLFSGIRPVRARQLLEANEAQTANNVKLVSGELRPWDNELKAADIQSAVLVRTIYLFRSQHWLEWSADVDVALGPVSGDTDFKFYYTGDGIPKKSNEAEATTGVGPQPINFYSMASPQPWLPPTVNNVGGGSGDPRDLVYTWTVVTTWGEESAPSPVSAIVSGALPGDQIDLGDMDLTWLAGYTYTLSDFVVPTTPNGFIYKCVQAGVSGGSEPTFGTTVDGDTNDNTVIWRAYEDTVASKFIYRLNQGEVAGNYQFVAQISGSATTYSDTKLDTELGEILQTGLGNFPRWTVPPDNLLGLVVLPNGILAGFVGKDIYFSQPFQPHAWPEDYVLTLDYNAVALGVMENNLVVATDQNPYIITGTTPATMTPNKMPESSPCISKRSIAEYDYGVIYATTDGLTLVSEGRAVNATEGFFTKKEWEDFEPDTFLGAYQDGRYYGFYDLGSFEGNVLVVDFDQKYITTLDLGEASSTNYAPAVHVDPRTDTLYYVRQTAEVLLQIGGTSYPNRTNQIVQIGSGDSILLIADL